MGLFGHKEKSYEKNYNKNTEAFVKRLESLRSNYPDHEQSFDIVKAMINIIKLLNNIEYRHISTCTFKERNDVDDYIFELISKLESAIEDKKKKPEVLGIIHLLFSIIDESRRRGKFTHPIEYYRCEEKGSELIAQMNLLCEEEEVIDKKKEELIKIQNENSSSVDEETKIKNELLSLDKMKAELNDKKETYAYEHQLVTTMIDAYDTISSCRELLNNVDVLMPLEYIENSISKMISGKPIIETVEK